MGFFKKSWILFLFVFAMALIFMVFPAVAEESTVSLPSLNPLPSVEVAPTGLPQLETGEQLPTFDNPNVNEFRDPYGKYIITFPQGTTQVGSLDDDIVTFNVPTNGKAYIPIISDSEEIIDAIADIEDDILGQGGNKVGQSAIQVGDKNAQVNLYGMDGKDLTDMIGEQFPPDVLHALLIVQYPGTNLMFILVLPKDEYQDSQSWILNTIKGVVFQ